jgi:uncharacterized protein (DUF362 family)
MAPSKAKARAMSTKQRDVTPPAPEERAAEHDHRRLERRAFLKGAALVSGLSAAAAYASLAPPSWPLSLNDPDGERGKPRPVVRRLPEGGFAVPELASAAHVGVAHGTQVAAMLRGAVDAIGGITRFIAKGDVVLIKPNVAFERPSALGATTNPEVLVALIELVRSAGASEVRVADNPIESPESCFARSGIGQAALGAGARVYLPSPGQFELLETQGATHIARWPFFWRPFDGVHKVIGVAPIKDHNLCRASMSTKNWYGLLGGRRNQFHQDIHGIISDLALMLKPTFVVLDGTRVLFRSGPTGGSLSDVRPGNTIIASPDSLSADAFGWDNLLGRSSEELPAYFAQAAARNLGQPAWRKTNVKELRLG